MAPKTRVARAELDRGYAWVVLAAVCLSQFLSIGMTFTSGVFFVEFLDAFGQSRSATAWVGSIHVALATACGPLVTLAMNKFGIRSTVIAGGLLACLGLCTSALAPNIWVLYVTYALATGVGLSMATVSSVVCLSRFFDKRKSLAYTGASVAVGLANLVLPLVSRELVEAFGWRGAMITCGGLALHLVVAGSLMTPTPDVIVADAAASAEAAECERDESGGGTGRAAAAAASPSSSAAAASSSLLRRALAICKSGRFLCLAAHICLFNFGIGISIVLTRAFALAKGVSMDDSVLLLSAVGLASLVGRMATLATATCTYNRVVASLVFCALCGASIMAFALFDSFAGLAACCGLIGLFFGLQIGNYTFVINRIMGDGDFQTGYGMLMFVDGLGVATGPPFAGWLHAVTGSYAAGFYCGGATYIAATLVLIPSLLIRDTPACSRASGRSPDSADESGDGPAAARDGAKRQKNDSVCVLGSGIIASGKPTMAAASERGS